MNKKKRLLLFLLILWCAGSSCSSMELEHISLEKNFLSIDTSSFVESDSTDIIVPPMEFQEPDSTVACDSTVIIQVTDTTECIKDKISIMQWNIGHFSQGVTAKSRITDNSFDSQSTLFSDLIHSADADIISLSEYTVFFAHCASHLYCRADTLLFKDYPFLYIGNNESARHYSLNAFFSKYELLNPSTCEFQSNANATITHTSLIRATDYYYIRSFFTFSGKKIEWICTHLAFDKNNPQIVRNQIEELIEYCKDKEYVIISGDFNAHAEDYNLFLDSGFNVAHNGVIMTYPANHPNQPLDNVISKGISISNVRTIPSQLSDHLPLICDLILH